MPAAGRHSVQRLDPVAAAQAFLGRVDEGALAGPMWRLQRAGTEQAAVAAIMLAEHIGELRAAVAEYTMVAAVAARAGQHAQAVAAVDAARPLRAATRRR